MPGVQRVALLALVFQTVGRHPDPDPLGCLEDVEVAPGELSLLYLTSTTHLSELDWALLRIRAWRPQALPEIAEVLAIADPLRAEALLHAWPPEAPPPPREAFEERWQKVETAMQDLRDDGLTASRTDVNAIAFSAYAEASGKTLDEVFDEFDV